MVLKSDKIRLRKMLSDSITVLCRAGLPFQSKVQVEALIGITLDEGEVVLLSFKETMSSNGLTLSSELVEEDDDADDRRSFVINGGDQNGSNPTSVTIKDEFANWEDGNHGRKNRRRRGVAAQKFRGVDQAGDGEQRGRASTSVEQDELYVDASVAMDRQHVDYSRFDGSSLNDNRSDQNFSDEGHQGFRTQMKVETDDMLDDNYTDDCVIVKNEEPALRECYEVEDNQLWDGHATMFDGNNFNAVQGLEVPGDALPMAYDQNPNWLPELSKPPVRKFKMPLQQKRQTWMARPSSSYAKPRNFQAARPHPKPNPQPTNNEAPESSLGQDVIGRPVMQCAYCSAVFNKSHVLKEHVNGVHFKKKLFHCPDCGESFKWRAELSRHRRVPGMCPCRGVTNPPDWPSQN